jgi:hypothetical protein
MVCIYQIMILHTLLQQAHHLPSLRVEYPYSIPYIQVLEFVRRTRTSLYTLCQHAHHLPSSFVRCIRVAAIRLVRSYSVRSWYTSRWGQTQTRRSLALESWSYRTLSAQKKRQTHRQDDPPFKRNEK